MIENEPCRKLFRLPTSGIDIPRIFEDIEAHKEAVGIVDYSLSQTTLEQVFLQLANQGDLGE